MKILICDDHKIVREGLKRILSQSSLNLSLDEAGSGNEAFKLLSISAYDMLLLDVSLPDHNGLDVLRIVKEKWPATRVLMLSMHPQEQYARRAIANGASGYLSKDTAAEELLLAVRKVLEAGRYISPSLAESLAFRPENGSDQAKHEKLSVREFEIMIKIARGISLMEIGNELFISNKTVSTYRSRIMKKMEFDKNTDLTRYCLENQLI